MLAVTVRTNLHHSMSNDWPTTAVAQTSVKRSSDFVFDAERTPYPLDAARIILNHAGNV